MAPTGAEALVQTLAALGVDTVFGLPGGAVLPVYDALFESPVRHVLARHEQGAGHMAEGYAQATGRCGVALVTSGPGLTNMVTPLCDALSDSVPLLVISGQVASGAIGTDAFQECHATAIAAPITKRTWQIRRAADIPEVLAEALATATGGRPGPVLVDLPKDVAAAPMPDRWEVPAATAAHAAAANPDPAAIAAAAALIRTASRPVLYAGGGVIRSGAAPQLLALAELCATPVTTTLMARGAFPDTHRLALGMPGMHGTYAAVTAMQRADLLVAVGARFDDRVTGKVSAFAPHARVVHVDIDPTEIGKVRHADVPVVADCRAALDALLLALCSDRAQPTAPDRAQWLAQLDDWKRRHPVRSSARSDDAPLQPQLAIERLRDLAPPDTVLAAGVGQHQMWGSLLWQFEQPRTWINSGGLGTMGFAIPAAIGAKAGRPDATVWAIDGDGCFQMTAPELITASVERIPVKVAVVNNGAYGMVRQWQNLFYGGRLSQSTLNAQLPDVVAMAQAMGCASRRVSRADQLDDAIRWANAIDDRPVVLDIVVDPDEMVYPMVPAGESNDNIRLGPLSTEQTTHD